MTIDEIPNELIEQWGGKTLDAFRREAERELIGTVYESIRLDRGPRAIVLMCVTNTDQIASLEKAFTFVEGRKKYEDWNTLTLLEVFRRTVLGRGFAYESLRDIAGKRSAIVLCSTEPRSMEILTFLFNFPV